MKNELQTLNRQNLCSKGDLFDTCDRITFNDIWRFMRRNNISDIHCYEDFSKNTLTVHWFENKD